MIINGCFYDDARVFSAVDELKVAVSRLPFDSPIRKHVEFLTSVIDVQEQQLEESDTSEQLSELQAEIEDLKQDLSHLDSEIDAALHKLDRGDLVTDETRVSLDGLIAVALEYKAESEEEVPAPYRELEKVRV